MIDLIRVLRSEVEDLQRIICADEAILANEKDPARRGALLKEIELCEDRIERLERRIDCRAD